MIVFHFEAVIAYLHEHSNVPATAFADRWGEIVFIAGGTAAADLPRPHEVTEWVEYVQHQCPECEGEAL
jgi:hypothetical protein